MKDHPIGNVLVLSALLEYFLWLVPLVGILWYWRSEEHKFAWRLFIPLYLAVVVIITIYDSLLTVGAVASQVRRGFWWHFIRKYLTVH